MSSFHPFCWFCFHGYWFCFKLPTTPWNQCFLLLCFYGFLSIYPLLNHPFWFLLLILWILSEWEWMHTAFVTGLCTALFVPCSFVPKLLVLLLPIFVCPPKQFVTFCSNWLLNYSPPTVWIIQAPFFVFAHCSITRGINYPLFLFSCFYVLYWFGYWFCCHFGCLFFQHEIHVDMPWLGGLCPRLSYIYWGYNEIATNFPLLQQGMHCPSITYTAVYPNCMSLF